METSEILKALNFQSQVLISWDLKSLVGTGDPEIHPRTLQKKQSPSAPLFLKGVQSLIPRAVPFPRLSLKFRFVFAFVSKRGQPMSHVTTSDGQRFCWGSPRSC